RVRRVILRSDTLDCVVCVRCRSPLAAMRPDAKLEIQSVRDGLRADELQQFQIAIAFLVGEVDSSHVVARNSEQERISEQKVRIADVIKKVIADAEIQAKSVE